MSTSSQPEPSLAGPAGENEQEPVIAPDAIRNKAELVQWPRQNPRPTPATTRTELLAKRQAIILRVLAEFSGESTLQGGLMAAADTLKMCFSGVRVSIGYFDNNTLTLAAVSQQANVDSQTAESELICAVMLEAIAKDQVVVTSPGTLSEQGMQAHRLLCAGHAERMVVSVPMCYAGECVASLCLERDSRLPMVQSTIELIRQICDMLAPMILARQKAERGIVRHGKERITQLIKLVHAPRYIKFKAIGLLFLLALLVAYSWQTTHWIKAGAELIPLERRVIAAPHEGYVHSVEAGSGDRVGKGEVLLRMDVSDATAERASWQSELDGLGVQMRAAMAVANRRQMAMLSADIDMTKARLSLVDAQLSRAVITAPVDGVVVSGDLSQMVGAPVSRGQLLLELAPEKGYEVHLMVDGYQINRVHVGDAARLTLQTFSAEPLELVIDRIHPIGIAEGGANRFRVIASTVGNVPSLMPGQTGIGKIDVGKASLLRIVTGDFIAWLKLKKWEWLG